MAWQPLNQLHATPAVVLVGDSDMSFTAALHTYFAVSSIDQVVVEGLAGVTYTDSLKGAAKVVQEGQVVFDQEVDRIYLEAPDAAIKVSWACYGTCAACSAACTDKARHIKTWLSGHHPFIHHCVILSLVIMSSSRSPLCHPFQGMLSHSLSPCHGVLSHFNLEFPPPKKSFGFGSVHYVIPDLWTSRGQSCELL